MRAFVAKDLQHALLRLKLIVADVAKNCGHALNDCDWRERFMRAYLSLMIICNHRSQLSLANSNQTSINYCLDVSAVTEFFARVFAHLIAVACSTHLQA